jgi:hypothetical protein
MNKDQGYGMIERALYGAIMLVAMKFVAKGYISADDAAWIAAGGVTAFGGVYAWWHNRPVSVLNRAGAAVPDTARLVILPTAAASHDEKQAAAALAKATGDKIVLAAD